MKKINEDEISAVRNLTRYPEWQVFKKILDHYVEESLKVTSINPESKQSIETQFLGLKYSRELILDLFRTINVLEKEPKVRDNTHE